MLNDVDIRCHTNLDVREEWPTKLPFRPMVGDIIRSKSSLELEVCRITIDINVFYGCCVELHLPKYRFLTIQDFEQWYKRR